MACGEVVDEFPHISGEHVICRQLDYFGALC